MLLLYHSTILAEHGQCFSYTGTLFWMDNASGTAEHCYSVQIIQNIFPIQYVYTFDCLNFYEIWTRLEK
jgi:hypothetical protein